MSRNLRNMCSRDLVISNSFWGLEEAMPVPPNIVLTGPLNKRDNKDLLKTLEKKDSALFAWMNDAESKREKILYLSLGSWTNWSEWSV